ncbi:MAG: hypothetical protein L0Y64_00215, partial [Myxococcaceae bacterium]|nr:hypothetical protein [Myxococcaceae bacterium]
SDAALLFAPELFARGGLINVGESVTPMLPVGDNALRITAGFRYSFSRLAQGLTLRQRADAECARYRAQSALQEALDVGRDVGALRALAARAAYLARALPEAEARVELVRLEVEQGESTLEELNALQLKLDGLRSLARQTEAESARFQNRAQPEFNAMPVLVRRFAEAEGKVERLTGGLRQMSAWDISLQGGYDRLFGVEQGMPFFALVGISYNLGGLFQFGADHSARVGRERYVAEDVQSVDRRTGELLADLRGGHAAERARLGEVEVLSRDLRQQLKAVEELETRHVRRYRDSVWFELARLEAEGAYLKAHLGAMEGLLRDPGK